VKQDHHSRNLKWIDARKALICVKQHATGKSCIYALAKISKLKSELPKQVFPQEKNS